MASGGTIATAGSTSGSATFGLDATDFSTNDAATFETYTDGGTGLTAIRPLVQGTFLITSFVFATASVVGLTAAQKGTLQHSSVWADLAELFGGGSYDRRILDAELWQRNPATGPSNFTTGIAAAFFWRGSSQAFVDVPAFGDNLGDQYGWAVTLSAWSDAASGLTFPANIAGGVRLHVFRVGDSVPTASLPWW